MTEDNNETGTVLAFPYVVPAAYPIMEAMLLDTGKPNVGVFAVVSEYPAKFEGCVYPLGKLVGTV